MFGFIYIISELIGSSIENIKRHKGNRESQKRAYKRLAEGQNPYRVYYDWQGKTRSLDTDEIVFIERSNDIIVIKDIKGNILRNITEEKINKEIKENNTTGKNKVVTLYTFNQLRKLWYKKFSGYHINANGWEKCQSWTNIYIYCKNNKKCFNSLEYQNSYKRFGERIENIAKEILNLSSEQGTVRLPYFYLDLFTGEILDYVEDTKHGRIRFSNKKGLYKEFSLDDTYKVINEYNKKLKTNEVEPLLTGWEQLFI